VARTKSDSADAVVLANILPTPVTSGATIVTGLGLALCGSGLGIGVETLATLDAELARIDIALQ